MIDQTAINKRSSEIADQVVPAYRNGKRSYSCSSPVAKDWDLAWRGACIALGGDPAEFLK